MNHGILGFCGIAESLSATSNKGDAFISGRFKQMDLDIRGGSIEFSLDSSFHTKETINAVAKGSIKGIFSNAHLKPGIGGILQKVYSVKQSGCVGSTTVDFNLSAKKGIRIK